MARLVLVHETEAACLARLLGDGFDKQRAAEIASYLAQSTDLAREFAAIEAACGRRGLAFEPVELDAAAARLPALDPAQTLVWTLTDGIAYFRGSAAPALARLYGLGTFGSDDSLFALCQDKFRSGAVLAALGLPVPSAGVARNGQFLVGTAGRCRTDTSSSPTGWAPRSASGPIRAAAMPTTPWRSAGGCGPPIETTSWCSPMSPVEMCERAFWR